MSEPEIKKRKIEIPDEVIDNVNTCLIEELINYMKDSVCNLSPVFSKDVTCDLPLKSMLVASVLEKKFIYDVIVKLNDILPLPECQYLKRVRDSEILLCSPEEISPEQIKFHLMNNGFNFSKYFKEEISLLSVVSQPPITKMQFEKAVKYWPCNFHPNKDLELCLSGKYFTPTEIKNHRKYMKIAYEIAEMFEDKHDRKLNNTSIINTNNYNEEYISKDSSNKDERFSLIDDKETIKKKLKELKGVVIVDPSIESIVAVGYDRRKYHPCQHPVMIAIDNVAKSQHGGVWNDDSMSADELVNENAGDRVLNGVPKLFRNILNASYDDLKFGAKPAKRRNSFTGECKLRSHETDEDDMIRGKELHHLTQASSVFNTESNIKPSGPYLCTGYDVYTTNEPCLMCSMALIHARARRVFFAINNEDKGALSSACQLHTVSYLNHHFQVFTGFFQDL